jgi:hypothetical protein
MRENGNVGTASARVAFVCRAPAHLDNNGALVDHLTVHEKEWAYCPSNVRTDGHDWKATGGVTMGELEIVVRGMRERAAANGDGKTKDR